MTISTSLCINTKTIHLLDLLQTPAGSKLRKARPVQGAKEGSEGIIGEIRGHCREHFPPLALGTGPSLGACALPHTWAGEAKMALARYHFHLELTIMRKSSRPPGGHWEGQLVILRSLQQSLFIPEAPPCGTAGILRGHFSPLDLPLPPMWIQSLTTSPGPLGLPKPRPCSFGGK